MMHKLKSACDINFTYGLSIGQTTISLMVFLAYSKPAMSSQLIAGPWSIIYRDLSHNKWKNMTKSMCKAFIGIKGVPNSCVLLDGRQNDKATNHLYAVSVALWFYLKMETMPYTTTSTSTDPKKQIKTHAW